MSGPFNLYKTLQNHSFCTFIRTLASSPLRLSMLFVTMFPVYRYVHFTPHVNSQSQRLHLLVLAKENH